MIFQRSSDVPEQKQYEAYRPFLRRDFEFRCAYCLRHEFFFGGGEAGEIDHFRPRHLFPEMKTVYPNLYWSCRKCNTFKGGKWPSEAQTARGLRFLDPCTEDSDDHWQTRADGSLTPLTPVGQYTVRQIRLDRPTLTEFRRFLFGLQARARDIEAVLDKTNLSPVLRTGLQAELSAATTLLYPPTFSL
jgi:hypothetical protein